MTGTVAWRTLLGEAEQRLATAGHPAGQASVEARWIIEEASGYEGTEFHHGLDRPANLKGVVRFDRMLARRVGGEPIQYVLGRWAFRQLDLMVDPRVLIPRPETEVVVEYALAELSRLEGVAQPLLAADLGTGSGAIGLSLAVEHRSVQVWLSDRSSDALSVARANLSAVGRPATRVTIVQGSWFEAFGPDVLRQFAVIVSNPPYVSNDTELDPSVADWEPTEALYAADGGTADLIHLLNTAPDWLRPDGSLVLELSPEQAEAIRTHALVHFVEAEVFTDLAGRERGIIARHPRPVG